MSLALSREASPKASPKVSRAARLSAAGFAATAISFGPGRMGFGLFAPELREAFALSTAQLGFISSLGFLGFLAGLVAAQSLLARLGPAAPVTTGLGAAAAGMGLVAAAPGAGALAAGVLLAGSSAGFAWTPFNAAVNREVAAPRRPAALSVISTGTSLGIAGAGLAALAMARTGLDWRACWALFALCAAGAMAADRATLRGGAAGMGARGLHAWRPLLRRAALPLLATGFAYGATSAVFIAFAADRLAGPEGVPEPGAALAPALVYVCYGGFGLAGLLTGRVRERTGLPALLRLLMAAGAASLALLALAPGSWTGLVLASGLQGVHVMMTSAVLAFWSERLFPALPSLSFTAALLGAAAGSVLGPAAGGLLSDAAGAEAMFLAAAVLPALTAAGLRGRQARLPAEGAPAAA